MDNNSTDVFWLAYFFRKSLKQPWKLNIVYHASNNQQENSLNNAQFPQTKANTLLLQAVLTIYQLFQGFFFDTNQILITSPQMADKHVG